MTRLAAASDGSGDQEEASSNLTSALQEYALSSTVSIATSLISTLA